MSIPAESFSLTTPVAYSRTVQKTASHHMGSGLFLLILSQNGIQQILLLHQLLSEAIERWLC